MDQCRLSFTGPVGQCKINLRSTPVDDREKSIDQEVLDLVFLILGLPHIDLVASKVNKNLSVLASLTKGDGEVYVVGMYKSGTIMYEYVFPPFFC